MTLIYGYQHRGFTLGLVIRNASEEVVTPGANDRVRVIIGREEEISAVGEVVTGEKFVVVSGTPTAAGSRITLGASNQLRIDASDLGFEPGTWTLYVDYFDNADAAEWKNVERQVFHLERT